MKKKYFKASKEGSLQFLLKGSANKILFLCAQCATDLFCSNHSSSLGLDASFCF